MIEGLKVVSAKEMSRIEAGSNAHEKWMLQAGRKVAEAVIHFVEEQKLTKKATLLVGSGNNGGDAYVAGIHLIKHGFSVRAFRMGRRASPLNRKFGEEYRKSKGHMITKLSFDDGVIVDGFLGTGFKGKVEGPMAEAIQGANGSGCPIIAVDIPSGLNGSTGAVESVAIVATETIALGLPKWGFFIRDGWNHVGRLRVVDFGLPLKAVAAAEALAYLPKHLQLPKIVRNRHKYQAGYVVGFGGSKNLPGAAKLAGFAALRAGAGIVRVFHPQEIGRGPLELICEPWSEKGWKAALEKAQAVFVGPGLGQGEMSWLKKHLKEIRQHCVIDADALVPGVEFPEHAVLTPHRGEMMRLLGLKNLPSEEVFFAKVTKFCKDKKVFIVLKGAPTFVFSPSGKPIIVPRGDPGMATAGTGDVLTGMIAGLLAQGCSCCEGAVLGAVLHGMAGEAAAKAKTSYSMVATDLFEFMPAAFHAVMADCDIV